MYILWDLNFSQSKFCENCQWEIKNKIAYFKFLPVQGDDIVMVKELNYIIIVDLAYILEYFLAKSII